MRSLKLITTIRSQWGHSEVTVRSLEFLQIDVKLQIDTCRINCYRRSRRATLHSLTDAAGLIGTDAGDLSGPLEHRSPPVPAVGWKNECWLCHVMSLSCIHLLRHATWPCIYHIFMILYVKNLVLDWFWHDVLLFSRGTSFHVKTLFWAQCVFFCQTMSKPDVGVISGLFSEY